MNRIALLAVVAAVLAAGAVGVLWPRDTEPSAATGPPAATGPSAPDTGDSEPPTDGPTAEPFELFDGDIARVTDWHGTPVVVNFWASWCPPCVAEMRDALEPMHAELGDEVVFLGLNLQDTPRAAEQVVERTGVTYTLGRDPSGSLFTSFGGFGMPTTIFIDANGDIVNSHTGAFTFDQLRALIQSNLGV